MDISDIVTILPSQESQCSITRLGKSCLLKKEINALVFVLSKISPGRSIGDTNLTSQKLLKMLLKETNCDSEYCVVQELLDLAVDTPYEAAVLRIKEIAFKPSGPKDIDALLDNFLLIHICMQIESAYSNVQFGGALTYDFMIPPATTKYGDPANVLSSYRQNKWKRLQFILNTDHRMGVGVHWTTLTIDVSASQIQYYDPHGNMPMTGLIKSSRICPGTTDDRGMFLSLLIDWIQDVQTIFSKHNMPLVFAFNPIRHQEKGDYRSCGAYTVMSLLLNARNISFDKANSLHITLDEIRKIRSLIYRPVHGYTAEYPETFEER